MPLFLLLRHLQRVDVVRNAGGAVQFPPLLPRLMLPRHARWLDTTSVV